MAIGGTQGIGVGIVRRLAHEGASGLTHVASADRAVDRALVTATVSGEIMSSRLNPYLTFNGNARQAMEFYAGVFGGNLAVDTFAEFGATDSSDADRIMHARLETVAGYMIMAGDVTSDVPYRPVAGVSISLSGDDADLLRGYWEMLSAGGTVTKPMEKQIWGDEFGMCVDRFGVSWMVNISQPGGNP